MNKHGTCGCGEVALHLHDLLVSVQVPVSG